MSSVYCSRQTQASTGEKHKHEHMELACKSTQFWVGLGVGRLIKQTKFTKRQEALRVRAEFADLSGHITSTPPRSWSNPALHRSESPRIRPKP